MTDGQGDQEDEACQDLKKFSLENSSLLTFAVGFGHDYQITTLQNIVIAGNTKTKWFTLNMMEHKPAKNCIIKIGRENLSLLIECSSTESLVAQFKRFASALNGLNESLL